MIKAALTVQGGIRDSVGKSSARKLKDAGMIPAVVYIKNKENLHISLDLKTMQKTYESGKFFSKLIDIDLKKNNVHVIPRQVKLHPVTDKLEHIDFIQVNDSTVIHVFIPVECINQDKSMGIKRGGVLNLVRREIEFICKPTTIPEKITIDIAGTQIGDSIHVNDIVLPEGVTPVIKHNFTIATIVGRTEEDDKAAENTTPAAAAAPDKKSSDKKAPEKKAPEKKAADKKK